MIPEKKHVSLQWPMSFEFGYLGKFEVKFETKLGFESGGPVFRLITYY
jgi:hypothetical protein